MSFSVSSVIVNSIVILIAVSIATNIHYKSSLNHGGKLHLKRIWQYLSMYGIYCTGKTDQFNKTNRIRSDIISVSISFYECVHDCQADPVGFLIVTMIFIFNQCLISCLPLFYVYEIFMKLDEAK